MLKAIRKADIVLLLILIIAGLLTWLIPVLRAGSSDSKGQKVVYITIGSEEYGTYKLSKDNTIVIEQDTENGKTVNTIIINNNTVHMENSTCKNQVCVDTGVIDRVGQSIVCLPNRVMVEIRNTNGTVGDDGFDAVSK